MFKIKLTLRPSLLPLTAIVITKQDSIRKHIFQNWSITQWSEIGIMPQKFTYPASLSCFENENIVSPLSNFIFHCFPTLRQDGLVSGSLLNVSSPLPQPDSHSCLSHMSDEPHSSIFHLLHLSSRLRCSLSPKEPSPYLNLVSVQYKHSEWGGAKKSWLGDQFLE